MAADAPGALGAPDVRWRMPPADDWRYCPLCCAELRARVLDGRPHPACPACGFVYWERPQPAAAAVVADSDGRLLYVRRRYPPQAGGWTFPGGGVEMGETAEEAAVREVEEETGLRVLVRRQLGVWSTGARMALVVFVLAVPEGGRLEPGSDAAEAAWFADADAPALCFEAHAAARSAYAAEASG